MGNTWRARTHTDTHTHTVNETGQFELLTLCALCLRFVFAGVDNSVAGHGKFDQAGVLNHIGTAGGTRAWANPCASGDVAVAWSSKHRGSEEYFVSKWDWKAGGNSCTDDYSNSWMRVDLGATRSLKVSHYALRHRGNASSHALRSWELQGEQV